MLRYFQSPKAPCQQAVSIDHDAKSDTSKSSFVVITGNTEPDREASPEPTAVELADPRNWVVEAGSTDNTRHKLPDMGDMNNTPWPLCYDLKGAASLREKAAQREQSARDELAEREHVEMQLPADHIFGANKACGKNARALTEILKRSKPNRQVSTGGFF